MSAKISAFNTVSSATPVLGVQRPLKMKTPDNSKFYVLLLSSCNSSIKQYQNIKIGVTDLQESQLIGIQHTCNLSKPWPQFSIRKKKR